MEFRKYFDHTNLNQNSTKADIDKLIDEAIELDTKSVCVNPCYVIYAKKRLKDTDIKVCTVVGFPLGMSTTETKLFETKNAIENGADEIDMVINIGKLLDKDYDFVYNEVSEIKKCCGKKILKCIIETALLNDEEIVTASKLISDAKADFVKTSTGFAKRGASVHDIDLIKSAVSGETKIKAAGGIGTKEYAKELIAHGASRIGTSRTNSILK